MFRRIFTGSAVCSIIACLFVSSLQPHTVQAAPIPGTLTWSVKAGIPGGVEGAAGGVIGSDKLFVSHGYRGFDQLILDIYTISTNSWSTGPSASVARSEMAGAVLGGKFYAIGGRTGPNADVESFDPFGAGTWTVEPSLSVARGGLGAATAGGKIYAVGGRTGGAFGSGTILGTNEEFDGVTWTTKAPMPTPLSDVYATVGYKGKVYVLGGATGSGSVVGLVQVYDPASNTWDLTHPPMPTPRAAAMVGVLCDRIIVFGGYDPATGNVNVTEYYDPADKTWWVGPPMPKAASEIAQGPTQTPNTIFAVGSGIFGVADSCVQALTCVPDAPIPTLSEWGGIIFGTLLLGSVMFYVWRRRRLTSVAV